MTNLFLISGITQLKTVGSTTNPTNRISESMMVATSLDSKLDTKVVKASVYL